MKCRLNPRFKGFLLDTAKLLIGGPILLGLIIGTWAALAYMISTTLTHFDSISWFIKESVIYSSPIGFYLKTGTDILALIMLLAVLLVVLLLSMGKEGIDKAAYNTKRELDDYSLPLHKALWYSIVTCEKDNK